VRRLGRAAPPDEDRSGWWARATPVGRVAFAVAVGTGVLTAVALALGPLLWPRWEAYLVARAQNDPAAALAQLRAVEVAIIVWFAALFAAGATLLADWWWDRARR
jgi:hypothetical protein